jgi:hypothetical protein
MTVEAVAEAAADVAATVTTTVDVRAAMLVRASPRELPPASSSLSSVAASAEAAAAEVLLPLLSKRWMDTHHAWPDICCITKWFRLLRHTAK